MGSRKPVVSSPAIEQLQDEIERMEETIAKLRQEGHIYTDAERHLNRLRDTLAQLP